MQLKCATPGKKDAKMHFFVRRLKWKNDYGDHVLPAQQLRSLRKAAATLS